jgi:phosphatidate cytidylyltransferase
MLLGPVLIFGLILLFWIDARAGSTAPVLLILACLLTLRSTWEMVRLLGVRFETNFRLLAIANLAVVCANWTIPVAAPAPVPNAFAARLGPPMLVFSLTVMALFVAAMHRYQAPGKTIETLGAELVALTYVSLFISLAAQLRWVDTVRLGYVPLASLVVATKCGDISAYFIGRYFGKTKLSPLISPGKTRAGAVGAFIGAAAGSWAFITFGTRCLSAAQPGPWYWAVVYGLVLGVVGLVGDLAESLLKRDVGVKDSAPLLPGFGGLLDLLDSVIFAAPAAYLMWLVLPLTQ